MIYDDEDDDDDETISYEIDVDEDLAEITWDTDGGMWILTMSVCTYQSGIQHCEAVARKLGAASESNSGTVEKWINFHHFKCKITIFSMSAFVYSIFEWNK